MINRLGAGSDLILHSIEDIPEYPRQMCRIQIAVSLVLELPAFLEELVRVTTGLPYIFLRSGGANLGVHHAPDNSKQPVSNSL